MRFFLLLICCLLNPVQAAWQWDDMWLRRDQQGAEQFNQNAPKEAATLFENPAWRGAALYQAEDYEAAAAAFSEMNTALGQYNLGNALAKQDKLDEAIIAYEKALQQQTDFEDAKINLELVKNKKEQQQKQEQQQEGEEEQEDKESGEKGEEGDSDPQEKSESGEQSADKSASDDAQQSSNDDNSGEPQEGNEQQKSDSSDSSDSSENNEQQSQLNAEQSADEKKTADEEMIKQAMEAQTEKEAEAEQAEQADSQQDEQKDAQITEAQAATEAAPPPSPEDIALERALQRLEQDNMGLLQRKFRQQALRQRQSTRYAPQVDNQAETW